MNFNQHLKEIRVQAKLTQKDVYTKLNISPNGYASWEQGRTEPSIQHICALCKLFEVSADYLLGLEN